MMTPAPDERIVAPPADLQWEERVRRDGATIAFVGKPPSTHYGIVAVFLAACAVFQIWALATSPTGNRARATAGLIAMIGGAMVAAWKWKQTATSGARVDVDGTRVRIESASSLLPAREVPLRDVEEFSAKTEIVMESKGGYQPSVEVETKRWHDVHLHMTSGDRVVVASFAQREHALFIAQRLDMVTERAKVVAGMAGPREPGRKPRPYRS